jgi:hypothetical protein
MIDTSSLDRVANECFAKLEAAGGDPRSLPIRERTIVVVYAAQGVIDNGGFQYLFESDFPGCPPYSLIVSAYRRIGAREAAECLDRAIRMFPFARPHRSQEKRLSFMKALAPNSPFFALGDRVCGDQRVLQALERFAQSAWPAA